MMVGAGGEDDSEDSNTVTMEAAAAHGSQHLLSAHRAFQSTLLELSSPCIPTQC